MYRLSQQSRKVWLPGAILLLFINISSAQKVNWWSIISVPTGSSGGSGYRILTPIGTRLYSLSGRNWNIYLSKTNATTQNIGPTGLLTISRTGDSINQISSYKIINGDTLDFGPKSFYQDKFNKNHLFFDNRLADSCFLNGTMLPNSPSDTQLLGLLLSSKNEIIQFDTVDTDQWPILLDGYFMDMGADGFLIQYTFSDSVRFDGLKLNSIPSPYNTDVVIIKVDENWQYEWHKLYGEPVSGERMHLIDINHDSTEYFIVWSHNEELIANPGKALRKFFIDRISLNGELISRQALLGVGTYSGGFFSLSSEKKLLFRVWGSDADFSTAYGNDVGFAIPIETNPVTLKKAGFFVEYNLLTNEIEWAYDLTNNSIENVTVASTAYNQWGDKFIQTSIRKGSPIIYNRDTIRIKRKYSQIFSQFNGDKEVKRLIIESDELNMNGPPVIDINDNLHLSLEYRGDSIFINDSFINRVALGQSGYFDISIPLRHISFTDSLTCSHLHLRYTTNAKVPFDSIWWQVNDTFYSANKKLLIPALLADTFKVKLFGAYNGFADTMIREKTIVQKLPVTTNFSFSDSAFCQFKEIAFYPNISAHSDFNKKLNYQWSVYNKSQKIFSSKDSIANWKATKSEPVIIELIASNGSCSDTFKVSDSIVIEPAAQGGFILEFDKLCAPATVTVKDTATGSIINRAFLWSDGQVFNQRKFTTTFDSVGIKILTQTLTGPTGCITEKSAWLRIRHGFTKNDSIQMLSVSVLDSQRVLLKWQTNPNAMGYSIIRQQQGHNFWPIDIFGASQDSIIDSVPNSTRTTQYYYFARMADSCYNMSKASNHASTIVLGAKNYNNEYVVLNWNAYEDWYGGVKEYVIERAEKNKTWLPIDASSQLTYPDLRLTQVQTDTVYYRIKAIEQGGNNQHSYSNVVKTPLNTTLFIPNAFTPNGDGINDIFKIGHFGLKSFECKIYSLTGQIVCISINPNSIWDGTFNEQNYPMANYLYIIQAVDQKGKELLYKGKLVLIR